MKALQAAKIENLLITPLALREKFDSLAQILNSDPVLANAALRKLIPSGLRCLPESTSSKKNLNQNNSKWSITGETYFAGADIQTINSVGYASGLGQSVKVLL